MQITHQFASTQLELFNGGGVSWTSHLTVPAIRSDCVVHFKNESCVHSIYSAVGVMLK